MRALAVAGRKQVWIECEPSAEGTLVFVRADETGCVDLLGFIERAHEPLPNMYYTRRGFRYRFTKPHEHIGKHGSLCAHERDAIDQMVRKWCKVRNGRRG